MDDLESRETNNSFLQINFNHPFFLLKLAWKNENISFSNNLLLLLLENNLVEKLSANGNTTKKRERERDHRT